jgi:hypothetical protein
MRYEPNPRHKEPWQPGAKGTLCPRDITPRRSAELLQTSILFGRQRFATDQGRAFKGKEHRPGAWHGHPVGWIDVPATVQKQMLDAGLVRRSDVRRYWYGIE